MTLFKHVFKREYDLAYFINCIKIKKLKEIILVYRREDPRDAVLFNQRFKGKNLATLPEESVIGLYK